jgi:hypothetical protein
MVNHVNIHMHNHVNIHMHNHVNIHVIVLMPVQQDRTEKRKRSRICGIMSSLTFG